jgi:hypothetical protein
MSLKKIKKKLISIILLILVYTSCIDNDSSSGLRIEDKPNTISYDENTVGIWYSEKLFFVVNGKEGSEIRLLCQGIIVDKGVIRYKQDDIPTLRIAKNVIKDSVSIQYRNFRTSFKVDTSYYVYYVNLELKDSIFRIIASPNAIPVEH